MKKLFILFCFCLVTMLSFGQHGNFTDLRLINGDSILAGTLNGTVYYDRVLNKFRFRQNGSWNILGQSNALTQGTNILTQNLNLDGAFNVRWGDTTVPLSIFDVVAGNLGYTQFSKALLNINSLDLTHIESSSTIAEVLLDATGVHLTGGIGGVSPHTSLDLTGTSALFTDTRATPVGLQEAADYSGTYTARSYASKSYVDAHTISGLTTGVMPYATSATTIGNSEITRAVAGVYQLTRNVNGQVSFSVNNGSTGSSVSTVLNLSTGNTGTFQITGFNAAGANPNSTLISGSGDIYFNQTGTNKVGISTIFNISYDRFFHIEFDDATTNAVSYVQRITKTTSGTAAIGHGVGIEFEAENASANNRVGATIENPFSNVTNTTERADLVFKLISAGTLTERLRITDAGAIGLSGANYGTAGQTIISGGSGGAATWGAGGGTPGGSTTQVQFNLVGAFAGNSNFTINNGTGIVTFGQLPTIPVTPVASTDAASKGYVDGLTTGPFSTVAAGYTNLSGAIGSILNADNTWLSGNITTTKTFLSQTGNGSISATPSWGQVLFSDLGAAAANSNINNGNFNAVWNWNSLVSTAGLLLSSNSTATLGNARLLEINMTGTNSTISQTTHGIVITNNHDGSIAKNYGITVNSYTAQANIGGNFNAGYNTIFSPSANSSYGVVGVGGAAGSFTNYGGYFDANSGTINYSIWANAGSVVINQKNSASAKSAPLYINGGATVLMTTPEDGAVERDASHLYFTIGSTRYQIDQQLSGSPWLLTGTSTFTGAVTIDQTTTSGNILKFLTPTLGVTPIDGKGLWIQNATAAAAGAQQISGSLLLEGQGWATTPVASQSVKWKIDNLPVQGAANPTTQLRFASSVNGSAYTTQGFFLSDGSLNLVSGGSLAFAGTGLVTVGAGSSLRLVASNAGAGVSLEAGATSSAGQWVTYINGGALTMTSGVNTMMMFRSANTFAPTSGTATYAGMIFNHVLNTTGTYSGTAYGIWYNPTLTSVTGLTHYGIIIAPAACLNGFGVTTPTALVHIAAGTATASTAPLKFNSGTNLTTAEAGAMEYNGTNLFFTPSGTTRKVVGLHNVSRVTAQNAANASVATWTVGANDGTFIVSANVLVTTATTHTFTVTCAYTDEGNTARTATMNFSLVAGGAITTSIANANGTVPYLGIPLHIRCKAATTITIATTGTFTTVTYNCEGNIMQIN